jgi:hypothetical protein
MKPAGKGDLPRIYFDTNNADENDRYRLNLDKSRQDIAAAGDCISDGVEVIIYMMGELEMRANIFFEKDNDYWVAVGKYDTIDYLE